MLSALPSAFNNSFFLILLTPGSIRLTPEMQNKFSVYLFVDYTLPGYNQRRSKRLKIGIAKYVSETTSIAV